jgi:V/A-type H+-transporting ATPase subunit I
MLGAAQMKKMRIFILERDEERVTRALGSLGAVHLSSSVEESGGHLEPEPVAEELAAARDLVSRLERLLADLGLPVPDRVRTTQGLPALREARELLGSLEARTHEQRGSLSATESALAEVEEVLAALSAYRDVHSSLRRLASSDLLSVEAVQASAPLMEVAQEDLPPGALVVPLGHAEGGTGDRVSLVVSSRRRRFAVETALQSHGVPRVEMPAWGEQTPGDIFLEAVGRRDALRERADALGKSLQTIGTTYGPMLVAAWQAAVVALRACEARRNFGATWATRLIAGWVPAQSVDRVRGTLMAETEGRCVVEISEPEPEEVDGDRVPTHVVYSGFLSPFGRLVRGYGVPAYDEIEPTLMFAASFLLMFGLVFGDLGHGLCLLAVGFLVARRAHGAVARDLGKLAMYAGGASALMGTFFQGSFFGASLRSRGFSLTVGFEPMRFEAGAGGAAADHVIRYMLLAVAFGVALVSLGLILNTVNRLRRGDFEAGLLGRYGVVGIVFYWGALGWALKLAVAGAGPTDPWLGALLIATPLVLLVLHEPLAGLIARRRPLWREGPFMGIVAGLVDAGEMVMGYVANTFSFLRVAAFALSHAALCFTVFVLQRLVGGLTGGPLWSSAVFVAGTALIIGLEGLIVTIQILRLEYYEFFTKFFEGSGIRYRPFRLDTDPRQDS